MIAAFIDGYGRDQVLKIGDFSTPKPGPSDILVKVYAASGNPIDFKLRDSKLRLLRHYRFPLILGHDCAGEAVEIGEKSRVSSLEIRSSLAQEIGESALLLSSSQLINATWRLCLWI